MASSLVSLRVWKSTEQIFRDHEQNEKNIFKKPVSSVKNMNNRIDSYTFNLYVINVLKERQFLTLNQYYF